MKKAVLLRELKPYSPRELRGKLGLTDAQYSFFIAELKNKGVIKEKNNILSFNYVGIILTNFCSVLVYPKYINNSDPYPAFKQVLRVIIKDNDMNIGAFSNMEITDPEEMVGILPTVLWLIRDYYENGLYSVNIHTTERNGSGEIRWEKTIEQDDVIISQNRPYYLTLYTSKEVSDKNNLIRKIHKSVICDCFSLIKDSALDAIFEIDVNPIQGDNFSVDEDYAINELQRALSREFNSRNRRLLEKLILYIQGKSSSADYDEISLFGTTAFNMVWQRVLEFVFSNVINDRLGSLSLPKQLDPKYNPNKSLLQFIEYPKWEINNESYSSTSTLIPDIISLDNDCFYILDAKYYNPTIEKSTHKIVGQPGIESVTKQYLYEQAYKGFMFKQGFHYVANAFVLPTDLEQTSNRGWVTLNFMQPFELANIQIVFASASQIYTAFLNDHKIKLSELHLHHSKIVD